jgi:hypothetical protein
MDGATGKAIKDGFSSVNPAFSTINVYGANALNLGTAGTYAGQIRFKSAGSAVNYFPVIAPAAFTDNVGWTLPAGAPAGNNYILRSSTTGVLSYVDPATFGVAASDTAYAGTWDGVTTIAPSKNAVYDEMELRAPKASPTFTGSPVLPTGTTGVTQAAYDNSAKIATTAYVDHVIRYHRLNIDMPTTSDNIVFAGPLDRGQTIDNVLFLVQDSTGKLSGASTDNVAVNISYCSSISTPTCTNVFTSDQTVTGEAISAGAMNNTAAPNGAYMRVTISSSNMGSGKKLYIRIKYRSDV